MSPDLADGRGGRGRVLPYMGYIGMCGKGYGFSAVLVINRVRVLGNGPHTPTQFFWSTPPGQMAHPSTDTINDICIIPKHTGTVDLSLSSLDAKADLFPPT